VPLAQAGTDETPEAGGNRFEAVMKRAGPVSEAFPGADCD
jgi:hypothetical protein